jgi:uncharacterized Zn finger protein
MNGWVNNLKSITADNTTGACPKCNSYDTAHEYVVINAPSGFVSIWCNECGAKAVIDCIVPMSESLTAKAG